ncbi:MAG: hypothetical protein ABW203_05110 [Novosphingobium sp.]
MTPQTASVRINRELAALEQKLAEGLEVAASLTATLVRARADTDTPAATGHELLLRLSNVQASLLKASGETSRVHTGLLNIGRELGIVDEYCTQPSGIVRAA